MNAREGSENITVKKEAHYTVVKLIGNFAIPEINDTIAVYEKIRQSGEKRLLIDTTEAVTDFSVFFKAKIELHRVLGAFDRLAVLTASSENAFKLKVLTTSNPNAQVYYEKAKAISWVEK